MCLLIQWKPDSNPLKVHIVGPYYFFAISKGQLNSEWIYEVIVSKISALEVY